MTQSILHQVASTETLHFTEALAAAAVSNTPPFVASAMYNIPGMPLALSRRFIIRAVSVVQRQAVGLEIDYFASATALQATDPALDTFLGRVNFLSAAGDQIGGAGLFRYYKDGLAIPYYDLDWTKAVSAGGLNAGVNPATLHITIQNIDTVAKSIGAAGNLIITTYLEPMQGY